MAGSCGTGGAVDAGKVAACHGNPLAINCAEWLRFFHATFKWARDNATALAPIEALGPGEVTVASLVGLDGENAFAAGDWVEVTDRQRTLAGEPGVLVRLSRVQGQVLTVEAWPGGIAPTLSDGAVLRRWDSEGDAVVTAAGSFPLEDGIEVRLAADAVAQALPGDAWLIPARRTATGGVLWPQSAGSPAFLPPQGGPRRYAPLAIVDRKDGVWTVKSDCRHQFGHLSALASLGKIEEAIVQYSEAIRLEPNNARTHNNLGVALADQGKLREAIAHYSEALRIAPSAGAHYNLGSALARDGASRGGDTQRARPEGAAAPRRRLAPAYAEHHPVAGAALRRSLGDPNARHRASPSCRGAAARPGDDEGPRARRADRLRSRRANGAGPRRGQLPARTVR